MERKTLVRMRRHKAMMMMIRGWEGIHIQEIKQHDIDETTCKPCLVCTTYHEKKTVRNREKP
eukprot:3013225-Pyramimonas_sp.AAC.1